MRPFKMLPSFKRTVSAKIATADDATTTTTKTNLAITLLNILISPTGEKMEP
jgi:hypothetical protein